MSDVGTIIIVVLLLLSPLACVCCAKCFRKDLEQYEREPSRHPECTSVLGRCVVGCLKFFRCYGQMAYGLWVTIPFFSIAWYFLAHLGLGILRGGLQTLGTELNDAGIDIRSDFFEPMDAVLWGVIFIGNTCALCGVALTCGKLKEHIAKWNCFLCRTVQVFLPFYLFCSQALVYVSFLLSVPVALIMVIFVTLFYVVSIGCDLGAATYEELASILNKIVRDEVLPEDITHVCDDIDDITAALTNIFFGTLLLLVFQVHFLVSVSIAVHRFWGERKAQRAIRKLDAFMKSTDVEPHATTVVGFTAPVTIEMIDTNASAEKSKV